MTKAPLTPEEATSIYGEPTEQASTPVVHIDFKPKSIGNPHYDNWTGMEMPHKPTGCITAQEAAAAARGWDARRKREWDEIIQAEIEAPAGPSEDHLLEMRRRSIESHAEGCSGDLARMTRKIDNMDDADVEALTGVLNHLHMQAGSVIMVIESKFGRDYVPPQLSYGTGRLNNMGGYSTDPRTGQRMCPISHYREPWPEGADNSRVTPPFEQV